MARFAITAIVTAPHFVASRIKPRLEKELRKPLYARLGVVLEEIEILEMRD
jgi:hypothetical protein